MNKAFYRVWCKFESDHINAPAGRRGQWRVTGCVEPNNPHLSLLDRWMFDGGPLLGIASTKPYPTGSIIRPHKELNRVLAACRAEREAIADEPLLNTFREIIAEQGWQCRDMTEKLVAAARHHFTSHFSSNQSSTGQ